MRSNHPTPNRLFNCNDQRVKQSQIPNGSRFFTKYHGCSLAPFTNCDVMLIGKIVEFGRSIVVNKFTPSSFAVSQSVLASSHYAYLMVLWSMN